MRKSKVLNISEGTEDARAIFQRARGEYNFTFDVFTQDDEKMIRLKRIIAEKLNTPDRNILLFYAEVGSTRDAAEMLGVSRNTFKKNLNRIREVIKHELCN